MKNICEWRDCAIFPDYYSISSDGRVFSKRRGKCLQPKKSQAGYLRVGLACNGKIKMMSVHRLVALAFIPNPENKPTINHINEIKTDNRVENLEWATNAEQNIHGTPLPKGHGRLIDADELLKYNCIDVWTLHELETKISGLSVDTAPTIIEADKGE